MVDSSYEMYRILTFLYSGKHRLDDSLIKMGITKTYIYGLGEFGKHVVDLLSDSGIVHGISDRNINETQNANYRNLKNVSIYKVSDIPKDNIPVIVTISRDFDGIRKQLISQGIDVSRIISLHHILLMSKYMLDDKQFPKNIERIKPKEFLIVGANFSNKGAQAMLFVTVSEIRKKYNNSIVWFLPVDTSAEYKDTNYRMIILQDGYCNDSTINEIMPQMDAVIDISGYALSSMVGFGDTDRMISIIKMAYDYNTPYVMMPQSFGPFDYPEYKTAELKVLLESCKVIFAREKKGYDALKKRFSLNNVVLSNDLVLQSKSIDADNIFINYEKRSIRYQADKDTVALIPNNNLTLYVEENELLEMYMCIIKHLLQANKKICIISHSEDYLLCKKLYSLYENNDKVAYYDETFTCIEFERFIDKFGFVVASRYHAIVHAYKKYIPCLIIGWADKYNELADLMLQSSYLIDVRKDKLDEINTLLDKIEKACRTESKIIANQLKKIKSTNCFDKMWDYLQEG